MNTKSNIIQMAIADGCKTIKDLALYINKIKSKEEKKHKRDKFIVLDSCFDCAAKINLS